MKSRSAKSKGVRLQNATRDAILAKFPNLEPDDVRTATMGATGEDILLSPAARRLVPLSIECKNQERLNIWASLEQSAGNGHRGAVVFKRNRSKTYIALELDTFLELI
jgi:hypothetical protein